MAGILAISVSVPTPGTAANNAVAGYVTGESIALSTTPTGSAYVWSLSLPAGSTLARAGLTAAAGATSSFTPDVVGEYLVACTVDSVTTYTIRCSVTAATVAAVSSGTRYLPVTDTSVAAPATGCVLYFSATTSKLSVKFPNNSIQTLTT
jgi:hypothetical protein